jgi:hypothetical protein
VINRMHGRLARATDFIHGRDARATKARATKGQPQEAMPQTPRPQTARATPPD